MRMFIVFVAQGFLLTSLCSAQVIGQPDISRSEIGTYSIVGWDSITGDLGVAVQSKFLGVGAVVPFAKAGVGAIASQAWANPTYGTRGLEMLEQGMSAGTVVENLISADPDADRRQLGIVDGQGRSYAHTGSACLSFAGHMIGPGYTAQGNILAGESVIRAMANAFEYTQGDLADRLLTALDAAERAGGDKRGRQSAALLVVREKGGYGGLTDRFIDIRVDDDSLPLVELRRIYRLWETTFLFDARLRSIDEFNRQRKFTVAQIEKQRVVRSLNDAIRNAPDDPEVLNSVAWVLATNDIDLKQAMELAERATRLAPTKTLYLNTLAECHYRLGQYDQAIAIEAELVTREPANDTFWKQLQKFREAKQKAGR